MPDESSLTPLWIWTCLACGSSIKATSERVAVTRGAAHREGCPTDTLKIWMEVWS